MGRTELIGGYFVLALMLLLGLFLFMAPGCRFVQPIADFVFKPAPAVEPVVDPVSGAGQLFKAVKDSNWLVTFSILGMAAGVFALMNGSKIGIPVIISCAVALFMSLAVARFALWMAVFGMIGAVLAVTISIIVKNKALKEVIGNVQDIKESAANGGTKAKIAADIKAALTKQANSTKKLISRIRAKL